MSEGKESQYLSVIRVWAAMAWADGVIADAETDAIRRLISIAELTEAERKTARSFLEQPVELDTAAMTALSEPARIGIYRAAVRLAMVDHDLAAEEASMLARLREGLGISDEAAESMQKEL